MAKRKQIIAGAAAAAVLVTGVSVWAYQGNGSQEAETVYKETTVQKGNLTVGVTESGSVTLGTVTQDVDYEESSSSSSQQSGMGGSTSSSSTTALEVEQVYVAVGQKVTEGDAVLKLTEDSIQEYRLELEEAVSEAQAQVNEANISAAKQKLAADYSYDLSVAKGTTALEVYENTLSELEEEMGEILGQVHNSQAKIAYYEELVEAGKGYSAELAAEQENYETLNQKLQAAQNNYTTKSIEAQKTYEETLLEYQNAEEQYSVDVNGVSDTVDTAQDTLEDAQEALADFEAFIGDGTIYAAYTGTVTALGYEAGDELSSDTSILTLSDPEAVTITVSVSEEDIAQIAVGDTVEITLTAYEDTGFSGTVQSIDASASSGSSTVSYNVTVLFDGDTDGIYGDMTGSVTFIEKQVTDVIYVSNKAIRNEGTSSYVKVKDADGNISKVEVLTGFSDGVNVEITSGLAEGDVVLIESQVVTE
ncbi:MAG: efflux RND transporter periplasmic adaptor subunit [Roseburia sp.]